MSMSSVFAERERQDALKSRRDVLAEEIRAMAGRTDSWTADDQKLWDERNAEYDRVTAGIKVNRIGCDGGRLGDGGTNPGGHNLSPAKITLQTTDGKTHRSIDTSDKFYDLITASGAPETPGDSDEIFGKAIAGFVTGAMNHSQPEVMNLVGALGGAGGFLIPDRMSARIIDVARNASSVMRAGVQTMQMDGPELKIARVLTDPVPGWTGEGQLLPSSNPTFGSYTMTARKIGVVCYMSTELEEDAMGVTNMVSNAIGEALALAIDQGVLRGTAAPNQPTGIRNWSGVTLTAIGGALTYDAMLDALNPIELANGSATGWIAHPNQVKTLRKLKDGESNYLAEHPDIAPLQRLISNQQTDGEITFGDFSQVLVGVRRNLRLEVFRSGSVLTEDGASELNLVQRDMVALRATIRMDSLVLRPTFFNVLTGIS